MKKHLQRLMILAVLLCASLPSLAQIDIRTYQQGSWLSLDTINLIIDPNDISGTGAGHKTIYFNVYNNSHLQPEACYVEAQWLCSNSSAVFQFCQQYPPDFTTGTCHVFQGDGLVNYNLYNYTIPPDSVDYNYLQCYLKIFDYSIEPQHEKICRFRIIRRGTGEALDSVFLIIRRGNLPCSGVATGIGSAAPAGEVANIYPNPARNSFTIAAGQEELSNCALYSMDGKMVWSANAEGKKTIEVNAVGLCDGVYYVKITDKRRKVFFKKILVDH